jgi:uncharacterized protein involved in exopolysaccharide biosynthesis
MSNPESNGDRGGMVKDQHYYEYAYTTAQSDTLRQFVRLAFKRRRLILLTFLGIVGSVALFTFLLPPIYRSSCQIYLERELDAEKAHLLGVSAQLPYEKLDWLNSEGGIVRSYPVAVRVIHELKLDASDAPGKILSEAKKAENFENTVRKFQKSLTVEVPRNSNIMDVAYEANSPQLAAAVVSKVVETYERYRAEIFAESETYKFFESQMKVADDQLRELEARQTEFKSSSEIVSPQAQTNILLAKLADYQRSLTETQTARIGREAKLKIIRQQFKSGQAMNIPTTESSNSLSREKYIAKLKGDLLDMEVRRNLLLQKFKPEYEEVVDLTAQIEATKKSIGNEVRQIIEEEESGIRVLAAQERALERAIAAINEDIKNIAQKENQLSQLTRGIEDNKAIYSMLLKQREEARISLAKAQQGVKIRIVSPAVVPATPIKPRKLLNLVLGIFLGLACGFGAAFAMEYYEHNLKPSVEFQDYLGMPKPLPELPEGDGSGTTPVA